MASISAASSQSSATLASAQNQLSMNTLSRATQNVSQPKDAKNLQKVEAAAQDFEAVFLTEMLKPMFAMVEVDPVFGGGKGEEIFRDFTVNEYAKQLAAKGGIGIAAQVKDELIRLQEAQSNPHAAEL